MTIGYGALRNPDVKGNAMEKRSDANSAHTIAAISARLEALGYDAEATGNTILIYPRSTDELG